MDETLAKAIDEIEDLKLTISSSLKKYTTYRLDNYGDIVIVYTIKALEKLVKVLVDQNYRYHLVGWGANQVFLNTKNVLFIKLEFNQEVSELDLTKDSFEFVSSFSVPMMVTLAKKYNLKNWELLAGIPASVGGAIAMNAGTSIGECSDLLTSVKVLKRTGEIIDHLVGAKDFSYRKNHILNDGDIILSAKFKNFGTDSSVGEKISHYLELRKETQPINKKTCGCVFKNYNSEIKAGKLIDELGLKGYGPNNFEISTKHANFIINKGNGTARELVDFINEVQSLIMEKSGYLLQLEIKVFE